MKKSLFLVLMFLTASVSAQLAITEVYEANGGTLKFVEIHNLTGSAIDLSAGGWKLVKYTNAGTTGSDISLTGSIPANGFYVVGTTDAVAIFGAAIDQTSGSISHTGDDEYELVEGATVIDAFASDHIGDTTDFSDETVAFRIMSAYPNNGDWGGTLKPADGGDSASGFWTVIYITAANANATTVATPGAAGGAGGTELPVELQNFSVE